MQTNELTAEALRRLAELRAADGCVLSIYLNLDPSQFATGQARSTAIRSLVDEADRRIRNGKDLSHDERRALREDLERVRAFFRGDGFDAKGAHALAVFACGPAGLFEAIKLPRPVESTVVIDRAPYVEPLADLASGDGRWCVLLVNRRNARILRGGPHGLEEVQDISDVVLSRHDQGGWSQARFQRGVDKEAQDHYKHTGETLMRRFKRRPFDFLVVGATEAVWTDMERELHPYLRQRMVGRVDVDVENTTPEQVRQAVAPLIGEREQRRERELIDRVLEGRGAAGRGVAGLDEVLGALNERRVEVLLIQDGLTGPGVVCPRDGWLGSGGKRCPVDGTPLEARDDVLEPAVRAAIAQSADICVVRHDQRIGELDGVAAVLRF